MTKQSKISTPTTNNKTKQNKINVLSKRSIFSHSIKRDLHTNASSNPDTDELVVAIKKFKASQIQSSVQPNNFFFNFFPRISCFFFWRAKNDNNNKKPAKALYHEPAINLNNQPTPKDLLKEKGQKLLNKGRDIKNHLLESTTKDIGKEVEELKRPERDNNHMAPFCNIADRKLYQIRSSKKRPASHARDNWTYNVIIVAKDGKITYETKNVSNIISGSSIHARDVIALGLDNNSMPSPIILPRKEAILVALTKYVKAIITPNEVLFFGSHKPSVRIIAEDLAQVLKIIDLEEIDENFELVALEELLRDVCSTWNRRVSLYRPVVNSILSGVQSQISNNSLYKLVPLKDSLANFEYHVVDTMHCIRELLSNDEDMMEICLTHNQHSKLMGTPPDPRNHESVELMLENYLRQLNFVQLEIKYFMKKVQNKQELAAISMDAYRNKMIRMNVQLAVGSLCLSTSTCVAGYFGMNLVSGFEEHPSAFSMTIGVTSMFSLILYLGCLRFLSERDMRRTALKRMDEINTISGILNNMNSLDYAVKFAVERESIAGSSELSKEQFRKLLNLSRGGDNKVTENELDLIFEILDKSGDGVFQQNELHGASRMPAENFYSR